jgi:hypothetical protein
MLFYIIVWEALARDVVAYEMIVKHAGLVVKL